jgi:acyl carrier protein
VDSNATRLRRLIGEKLAERGIKTIGDHDSLFVSGLLDSMAAVEVMMVLESEFGIDLSDADFEIARLDTLADLDELISVQLAA